VGGMILEKDMLGGTGRRVGMYWRWSWRLREYGIIRVISKLIISWEDQADASYVHRLIQSRNDGKLVELPSASSLVTSYGRPLPLNDQPIPQTPRQRTTSDNTSTTNSTPDPNSTSAEAGPSSNDMEKMSTIEAITLEYSYLLSSQLEAMRQHYESQQSDLQQRLESLETRVTDVDRMTTALQAAEKDKAKAEKKSAQAVELSRSLQTSLAAERAMAQGLSERIKALEGGKELREKEKKELEEEKQGLEETVRDLMFSLEAGMKIQQMGGEAGEGGDLVVKPTEKKGKKKR
jgi:BRCA1-associated protein